MSTPQRQSALDLVLRSDFTVLSTLDDTGTPDARIIFNLRKARAQAYTTGAAALPAGFDTWIATNTSSRKVRELRDDPRGSLYYFDTSNFEGLTLQGSFEEILEHDIRASIWVDGWNMYYPDGLDGGDFSVFRFRPTKARYYHGLGVTEFDPA